MLPTTSKARSRIPPRLSERVSASSAVEAAMIIPSTENGVSAATQPGWLAVQLHQGVHVKVRHRARNER
jgi:hypothetical protein